MRFAWAGFLLLVLLGCAGEICGNDSDDDADSQIDSEDGDCRLEDCEDLIDNDEDGHIDCWDLECWTYEGCGERRRAAREAEREAEAAADAAAAASGSDACCKHCGSTSQACGDTCISNSSECHTASGCACY